jgi:tight adherence protein B
MNPTAVLILANLALFTGVFLFVAYGLPATRWHIARTERSYERVLVNQLLMDIKPRTALLMVVLGIVVFAMIGYLIAESVIGLIAGAAIGFAAPVLIIRHLERKRMDRLENQLVDGITTMASGVRAGLNLIQAMEILVRNMNGPIQQEFAQLLREYQMGMDFNQAMRSAANRIGSSNYRLLFTALEMHRLRGGDVGQSLDRISESIREIQRLEGKLDAITAQGRFQAWMMAVMPLAFLGILFLIDREGVAMMFAQPLGRIMLMGIAVLILLGWLWIRKIMTVDI